MVSTGSHRSRLNEHLPLICLIFVLTLFCVGSAAADDIDAPQANLIQKIQLPGVEAIHDAGFVGAGELYFLATTSEGHDRILLHDLASNTSRALAQNVPTRPVMMPGSHRGFLMWHCFALNTETETIRDEYFMARSTERGVKAIDGLGPNHEGAPSVLGIIEETDCYLVGRGVGRASELILRDDRHEDVARLRCGKKALGITALVSSPSWLGGRFFVLATCTRKGKSKVWLGRIRPFELVESVELRGRVLSLSPDEIPGRMRLVMRGGPHESQYITLRVDTEGPAQPALEILETRTREVVIAQGERQEQWIGNTVVLAIQEPAQIVLFPFQAFVAGSFAQRSTISVAPKSPVWGFCVDAKTRNMVTWDGGDEVKVWQIEPLVVTGAPTAPRQ